MWGIFLCWLFGKFYIHRWDVSKLSVKFHIFYLDVYKNNSLSKSAQCRRRAVWMCCVWPFVLTNRKIEHQNNSSQLHLKHFSYLKYKGMHLMTINRVWFAWWISPSGLQFKYIEVKLCNRRTVYSANNNNIRNGPLLLWCDIRDDTTMMLFLFALRHGAEELPCP